MKICKLCWNKKIIKTWKDEKETKEHWEKVHKDKMDFNIYQSRFVADIILLWAGNRGNLFVDIVVVKNPYGIGVWYKGSKELRYLSDCNLLTSSEDLALKDIFEVFDEECWAQKDEKIRELITLLRGDFIKKNKTWIKNVRKMNKNG